MEGLRAVAVLLVLAYHAGSRLAPGGFVGVDVFFVISGFLITSLLLAELDSTGTISVAGFYGRRAKRLLPAAGVVLATVAALTLALLPKMRWIDIGGDIVASATYVANWRFAETAVDYLARDDAPSPVQHFWSLAVEEQFYLLWPALLLLAALWARRTGVVGRPSSRSLFTGWALVFGPSLAWSMHLTTSDPGRSYFVTTTRMWELALGGLVAILATQAARLPRAVGALLAWTGLLAVVAAAGLFSTATPFPGSAALLPTVGAAAIIAGGPSAGRYGPVSLLGVRPMQGIGALSYSLYLWHWPLLVIAARLWGELSTMQGLALVAFSAVPAYATYRWVENPLRRSDTLIARPLFTLKLAGVATLSTVIAGMAVVLSAWPPAPPVVRTSYAASVLGAGEAGPGAVERGAQTLAADPRGDPGGVPVDRVASFTPSAEQARDDLPVLYDRGCPVAENESDVVMCDYGDLDSSYVVALVGDSLAAQWASPLIGIAVEREWHLKTYTKSSCPLADVTVRGPTGAPNDDCTAWNANLMAELTGPDRPDVIIVSSSGSYLDSGVGVQDGTRGFRDGLTRTWAALTDHGIKVVALVDTPKPGIDIAECASVHADELRRCAVARTTAIGSRTAAQQEAAAAVPSVSLIDLNDAICPADSCAAVIGGVLVYRDTGHLTDTYARTLAPRLDAALAAALA